MPILKNFEKLATEWETFVFRLFLSKSHLLTFLHLYLLAQHASMEQCE